MQTLPPRQAETLAQKLLGLRPSQGLDGSHRATAAGYSGMIGRLYKAGLLAERYGKAVTAEGLNALEANLDKLPVIDPSLGVTLDSIRAAIASRRAELNEAAENEKRELEEWRRKREEEKLERNRQLRERMTTRFRAFFDERRANVEWDYDRDGSSRVLVDAVFPLGELVDELVAAVEQ
jgi:hypothetical protein